MGKTGWLICATALAATRRNIHSMVHLMYGRIWRAWTQRQHGRRKR